MAKKTFYVTTPIYYPSGNLHIGHVYTTTLAWVLRNYKRANGYDAIMLTGADEHGQKIELKAQENNVTPQKYVTHMTLQFKALWKKFALDFDLYSRTTNLGHVQAVQKQFTQLLQSKEIFKGHYQGLYSVNDEEFLTKMQATKQGDKYYHPISGHELQVLKEESYFLKVSQYEAWIKEYYKTHPMFIIPQRTAKELLNNFINQGLEDLSVSRSSFTWGITIKEDQKHIIYVWLDALNNYLTALGYHQEADANFQKYWVHGDEIVHIVGREITRFHGIYWPIILKVNKLRQPTTILAHGWIITPEGKMSKSKGNVIDPFNLITSYGHEQLKYYLASQIKVGQDGVFENHAFVQTINADLANNVGNLITRSLALVIQNFQTPIKHLTSNVIEDQNILNKIEGSFRTYKKSFDEFKIAIALKEAIALAKQLNQYIDATRPWTLKTNKVRLSQILNVLLNGIYAVATMLNVVMPQAMQKVQNQLNIAELSFAKVLDFHKFDDVLIHTRDIIFKRF